MQYLKLKFTILIFCVFICAWPGTKAYGQINTQRDLSGIHVADLSDAQVRQLMQQAALAGYSDSQLIQAAEQGK